MAEYIKREAAIEAAKHAWAKGLYPSQYLEDIPAADVAPVVHGRWIKEKTRDDFDSMKCTACNGLLLVRWHTRLDFFRYCPNCGARMDLEEPNEAKESGQP